MSRNRCREGFRRRQYFNRRQIYRPPAARPYEMAGARVTCHFVKWSHVSRGHLAVCLHGGSVLSVMCRYARVSFSSRPRLVLTHKQRQSRSGCFDARFSHRAYDSSDINRINQCKWSNPIINLPPSLPLSQNASISYWARRRDTRREKYWKVRMYRVRSSQLYFVP